MQFFLVVSACITLFILIVACMCFSSFPVPASSSASLVCEIPDPILDTSYHRASTYSIRSLKPQSRGVTHILFGFEALILRITIDAPRPAWVDALYENMHAIQKAYENEMQREFRPIKASYNDLKRKCGKVRLVVILVVAELE